MQAIFAKKPLIDQTILHYLKEQAHFFREQQLATQLFALLTDFIIRGKTLRGALLLSYLEASNPQLYLQKQPSFLKIAAALEIIHAGLLIHDDIIDQDEQRRGYNSVWQIYRLQAEKDHFSEPVLYGKNQAICVGSVCQYLANQLIEQVDINHTISREISKTYLGEMLDSQLTASNHLPELANVLEMYHFKTARYTFGLPLKLAAMLGKASVVTSEKLEQISNRIGLIFQIKDDLIGMLAEEKISGKPALSDIREGKRTIVYLQLQKNCNEAEKTFLSSFFGQKTPMQVEVISELKQLIIKKALPDLEARMQALGQESIVLIDSLEETDGAKKLLKAVLTFNLERNY